MVAPVWLARTSGAASVDGALVEQSGRRRSQPYANAAFGATRKCLQAAALARHQLQREVHGKRGQRLESVRGLCKSPAKRGFFFFVFLQMLLHALLWSSSWSGQDSTPVIVRRGQRFESVRGLRGNPQNAAVGLSGS